LGGVRARGAGGGGVEVMEAEPTVFRALESSYVFG
jgi:hypothetical protein